MTEVTGSPRTPADMPRRVERGSVRRAIGEWVAQHGLQGSVLGMILDGLADTVSTDKAVSAVSGADAALLAAQVCLDVAVFAERGLAGEAVLNRAIAARDGYTRWVDRDAAALALSRAAEALGAHL